MRSGSVLWFILVPSLFCAGFCAVLENNEEPGWAILAAEREALGALNGSTTFQTSTIDPAATELDLGSQIKPGLFAIDANTTKQTIFLIDGEASKSVTYVLNLRTSERVLSVLHVTNDSKVITTHSKQVREISGAPTARYNISLEHEFEGTVGVASYILHVTTSYARFIASGTFYVSGIVALIPGEGSSLVLASGIESPGLSFPNPDSVTLKNSSIGQLPLSIAYQEPGPDVMETFLSLGAVMGSAKFYVQDSGTESDAPLLKYNASECSSLTDVEKDESGYFIFQNPNCAIGFHAVSKELIINLNRERSGTAAITVSLPLLHAGEEMFETSINIFIGDPSVRKPVLLIDEGLNLVLDHYGSEEFSVKMYNTIRPAQQNNATGFYMDLPGGRYATIDFSRSIMTNPTQVIAFKTVTPGQEDATVLELIQAATDSYDEPYIDLTESLSNPNNDPGSTQNQTQSEDAQMPLNVGLLPEEADSETSVAVRVENDDALVNQMLHGTVMTESKMHDPTDFSKLHSHNSPPRAVLRKETTKDQSSNVYVVIPPKETPIRAVRSGQGTIRATIASQELTAIDSMETTFPEKLIVTMALEGYSIANFSEHKSQQIKMALLDNTVRINNGTEGEVRLVNLRNEGSMLIAELEVFVSGNNVEIADGLMKKEISANIAKEAYLAEDRVEIISAKASTFKDVPGNLAGGDSASTLASSSSGVIIAAIVILALVVAIPLFVLCFGFIVARRHQQDNEASDANMSDSTTAAAANSVAAGQLASPQTGTVTIARDEFGRGDDITNDSFKMQKELFKDGYFGDNKPSGRTAKED